MYLYRKVDTYGITNIKTYGLILIRLSQAPEFKFHSVSYTLISSKLFLVHAYSYRQGVNMNEIKDILFLICSQIYKQANVLNAYMYTIAGSEQVFG